MNEELVLYESRGPAIVLTMNRPAKRNALSRALISGLAAAFKQARDQADCRCVILTGAGPAFSAGMDLAELAETLEQPQNSDAAWKDALHLAEVFDLIYSLPKPVIAAVNGPAVAGGAGLVTVCDLALAVPEARFGYPEVRRGLVAAMVMPHLLRHVGERAARFLLLTGDIISAEEAWRVGLINGVVPGADLVQRACEWAHFVADGAPGALQSTKALLQQFSNHKISVEAAAQESAAPRLSEECQHGLRAFFEKKRPPWLR